MHLTESRTIIHSMLTGGLNRVVPIRAVLAVVCFLAISITCKAQDVKVLPSADWHPLSPARMEQVLQQAKQSGGSLVDGSSYSTGYGAVIMRIPVNHGVDQHTFDNAVAGYIGGVTDAGMKYVDREPVSLGGLPGVSLAFAGKINGRESSMLAWLLFTDHDMYSTSFYGVEGMTRTDPMVVSYLARLQVEPSAVPAKVDASTAYQIGKLVGKCLVWAIIAGIVVLVIRLMRRRKKPTGVWSSTPG